MLEKVHHQPAPPPTSQKQRSVTAIRQVSAWERKICSCERLTVSCALPPLKRKLVRAHNTLTSTVSGDFKLWVRADYVLRAIESFDAEVQMTFLGAKSPLYFKSGNFKSMVMPIEANLPEPVLTD